MSNIEHNYIYGETFSAEAPKPTAVVFDVIAQHLPQGVANEGTHETLNDVYKAVGGSEREAERALDAFEQQGLINREDVLVLTVLLAVSESLGHDLNFLRRAILTNTTSADEIRVAMAMVSLDPIIANYVQEFLTKLVKK